jgi:hypothetical protein
MGLGRTRFEGQRDFISRQANWQSYVESSPQSGVDGEA